MTTIPQRRARVSALVGVVAAILAACGDGGVEPRPSPPPPSPAPVGGGDRSHRAGAALDSVFGADAATLDSALAAEAGRLDAQAAAWLDSVAAALAPDLTLAGATAVPPGARRVGAPSPHLALAADGRAERAFTASASVPTRGGKRRVRIDYTYALTVTPTRVELVVQDADLVHDDDVVGTPGEQDFASYVHIATRTLTLAPCPDASGRSVGTWKGESVRYGQPASREMAGPRNATFRVVERAAVQPVRVNVGDDAYRRSVDYEFAYDVEYEHARTFWTGGAEVRRPAFSIVDVILEVPDALVSNVSGGYHALERLGVGSLHSQHFWFGDDLLKASGAAQRVWRGGHCVEVQEPGGPVQPASPNARMTLRPVVVHTQDGTRPAAPIEARAAGGAVSPDGVLVPAPASFAYTASPTGAGQVAFRTVSRRGIGVGTVRFTPVGVGDVFEYESQTRYAIDSRGPLDDTITGEMHGVTSLASRLTLVPVEPDEGDDRAFAVVAATEVRVNASGAIHSEGPAGTDRTGETTFTIVVEGSSANPAPDAPDHDQVGPEQFTVATDTAGVLRLFRHAGRDYYALDLGLSGAVGTFGIRGTAREACRDPDVAPASTSWEEYDNASRRYVSVVSDPGDCWPHASDDHTRDRPYAFGAIGLERTSADPETGRSEMFIGTYDARAGVIEGSETRVVSVCAEVAGRDPLQLTRMVTHVHSWRGDLHYDQGQCTLSYTARWRFFVPAR